MNDTIKKEIYELVESAKVALVSSIDKNGYPNTKCMLALQHDDMGTHYFSTNYSARRTQQFMDNPHACIYYFREHDFRGVMLIGNVEVCTDQKHKDMLWREGFECYYPQGVTDPDYCVFKFTAQKGNYYHGLKNYDFAISEILK